MKKNQLIIMPRFVDVVGDWYYFQLGIAYVSASLKKHGFNIFNLNLNTTEGEVEDILRAFIQENNIEIVSTGGITAHYKSIRKILDTVKEINPEIITIVGGGIISSDPESAMMALENVDYGIIGEGELTSCELSEALENGRDVSKIQGIIYKKNGQLYQTEVRKEIADLDALPFPDYKGFDFDKTLSLESNLYDRNEKNSIVMISSRSCPFRCTFCFHTSGQKFRQRSVDNFFEELDLLLKDYKIRYIYISDELFTYNKDRVVEFCKRIKSYGITWGIQARVTDITEELVQILKDANCITIALGIESADNHILKSMKKYITIEQTAKALEIIYASGIHIAGGFIFGDVEETFETATNTLNWWKNNTKYGLGLNFITTYPGTELYKHAIKNNIIKDPVQFIRDGSPTVNVSKMTKEEIKQISTEIINLTKENLKAPLKIKDFKIDSSGYRASFKGICCYCGTPNEWTNVKLLHRSNICCSGCGTKHKTPIDNSVLKVMDNNLEELAKRYQKIAFWGITDIGVDWLEHLNMVNEDNVFYVDTSKMKQNSYVNKKMINSPDIIKKENIKVVIVPVISFYSEIKLQIENEYPNVEIIIPMIDLMSQIKDQLTV